MEGMIWGVSNKTPRAGFLFVISKETLPSNLQGSASFHPLRQACLKH